MSTSSTTPTNAALPKSEFPKVWRWLQSLSPLQRVQALSLNNEVAATVIINLVYYERKEVWNTLKVWDNESFVTFIKEVRNNVVVKHLGKKRPRGLLKKPTTKSRDYKPVARSQFWQVQMATSADPKILARNINMGRSTSDARKDELVRNRKKCVKSLCVMRSNDTINVGSSSGLFKASLSNYVDTIAVSYEAVHNDNMAKLWSQLMTYSDGQFLQHDNDPSKLPRDEFCAGWFRGLERFSFQALIAGILEIALLKSYALDNGNATPNDSSSSSSSSSSKSAGSVKNSNSSSSSSSSSSSNASASDSIVVRRLSSHSSQRLLQVERLADFWKGLSLLERNKQFQEAYKNTNDLVTQHGNS